MKWIVLFALIATAPGWAEGKCPPEKKCIWKIPCKKSTPAPEPEPEPIAIPSPLLESYWAFHKWAALGYRFDRQSFLENNFSKTTIHNRNSLTLRAGSHVQYRNFILGMHGGYGWLLYGDLSWKHFSDRSIGYSLGAGYTADAQASLGYEIKLVQRENFGFSVIPALGYRYAHLMNWAEKEKGVLTLDTLSKNVFSKPNQQDWFGPFVDARIRFKFWKSGQWDLYYQYQPQDMRSRSTLEQQIYSYDPAGDLALAQLIRRHTVSSSNTARAQIGGTDIRIHHATGWTFGLYFEAFAAWTHTAALHSSEKIKTVFPAPLATARVRTSHPEEVHWTNYSLTSFMGYKF